MDDQVLRERLAELLAERAQANVDEEQRQEELRENRARIEEAAKAEALRLGARVVNEALRRNDPDMLKELIDFFTTTSKFGKQNGEIAGAGLLGVIQRRYPHDSFQFGYEREVLIGVNRRMNELSKPKK